MDYYYYNNNGEYESHPSTHEKGYSSNIVYLLIALIVVFLLIILYLLNKKSTTETQPIVPPTPPPITPATPSSQPITTQQPIQRIGGGLFAREEVEVQPATGGAVTGTPLLDRLRLQQQQPTTPTQPQVPSALKSPSPSADVQTVINYILARGTTLDGASLSSDMKTALGAPTQWLAQTQNGEASYFYPAKINTPSAYRLYYDTYANLWNMRVDQA